MSLPTEVRSHQTVRIDVPGGRTVAVRYELDGDDLVCFGDDGLGGLAAGAHVPAGGRGLAGDPLDANFWARVRDLEPGEVPLALLSDLIGDRVLGRPTEEVVLTLDAIRTSRRLVALQG